MKNFIALCTSAILLMPSPSFAEDNCENTTNIKVNGLVCDFCARALEKVFSKQEAVERITVDLNNSNVMVITKPGKEMQDELLTKLITDAGYNVANIRSACDA